MSRWPPPPVTSLQQNVFLTDNEPARGFVPRGAAAQPAAARAGGTRPLAGGKGKGPGPRLRTGGRLVGHEPGLRCLLGARALSRPNPPSSRNLMSLPVRLASPVLDCSATYPSSRRCQPGTPAVKLLNVQTSATLRSGQDGLPRPPMPGRGPGQAPGRGPPAADSGVCPVRPRGSRPLGRHEEK